jgi:hypothetical protein
MSSDLQLVRQGEHKIFRPACRGDHAVGQGFLQFGVGGAGFLRGREVFFQSGRAADGHGTADPDQLSGARVQHLFVAEIKNLLS